MTTLLLLHGLGATAGVWAGLIDQLDWSGPVVAPDLPGHGRAPWTDDYTLGSLAATVVEPLPDKGALVVVGHSLGGAVGLELGSGRYHRSIGGVLGIGIKSSWSADDVAGMARVAAKGLRWFDDQDEAVARFLRQAGLDGIVAPDDPMLDGAVVSAADDDGRERWRVAQDPATFAQEALDLPALVAAARCPVILAAGEHDAMAPAGEMAAIVDRPRTGSGLGHNAAVEDPAWAAGLVGELLAEAR